MAKFVGTLGVVTTEEEVTSDNIPTGVYKDKIVTYKISGDLLQYNIRNEVKDKVNTDINIANRFSFIASPRLLTIISQNSKNLSTVYLEYFGVKLRVSDIQITPPRITLSTSGLWIRD